LKTENRFPDATGGHPPKGHHETYFVKRPTFFLLKQYWPNFFFLSMICNELALFKMLPSCEEGGMLAHATVWFLHRLLSFTITKNYWPKANIIIQLEYHLNLDYNHKMAIRRTDFPSTHAQWHNLLPVLIPNSLSRVPSGGIEPAP
jgi:hypothetical protein